MASNIPAIIHFFMSPGTAPFESLQAILTKANPPIRDESSPPRNVPPSKTAASVNSFEVTQWADFNLETLMEAYGDILNEQVQVTNHAPTDPPSMRSLADLKMIGQRYIFPALEYTIEAGARHIGIRLGRHLPTMIFRPSPAVQGNYPPLALCTDNEERLLFGCVQFAKQWQSSDLLDNPAIAKRPIGQLVTYCNNANTRYGFVLTSSEVVVIRLSRGNTSRLSQVEWQAIPWDASGDNVLTVNLALWFLAMMSLNGDHRAICRSTELLPLNTWSRSVNPDGQVIYQHHLSMRKRFDLPAGAVYTEV
ncbi:hypothetical protein CEP52_002327 [Fusarium oligoseptatum]|uniref:Uncharacterized protein n=2 Tax=Fusarium solani species complex TaxID=232080 RepID=A0A428UE89_9HYPO|nr:hypothetical protein CEP51_001759 [Fusarium floridanum]RSM12601.1 hypothetical protein CEP52_002327 [Fusarium oligoseptatum]